MEQYKIYTVPDEPYLRRLEKESQSGDGSLLAYYEDDLLQGVFAESFEEDEVYIRWAYSLEPEHMINQIKQRHKGKKIYITEGNLFKGNSIGKDFIQSKKYQRSWQGSRTLLLGERSCKERTILHSGYW